MDEEVTIINEKTRNEKIKNFLIDNKKKIIFVVSCIVIIILGIYSFQIYKESDRENLSEKYNNIILDHNNLEKNKTFQLLKEIIKDKDSTYSPLALYFLIDNQLIDDKNEINYLFDILIDKTSLEPEIRNLIIYKKALFNADDINESELLAILNPLINSESVWKSHSLYLIAEYFYAKNEKEKSREFYNKIISLNSGNQDIKKESLKRLNRDLGE